MFKYEEIINAVDEVEPFDDNENDKTQNIANEARGGASVRCWKTLLYFCYCVLQVLFQAGLETLEMSRKSFKN